MTPTLPEIAPPASGQPPDAAARPQKAHRPSKRESPRPARTPHPLLERLAALYPRLFGAQFLPLKIGVFEDLVARHPDEFKKEDLKLALGQHTRSTRYLESVAAGHMRHDLDGVAVEPMAPEHVQHAIMEVFRRRQQRSRHDLRPWLQGRLVQAIQACGLTREAYLERVHTQDPVALAALDQAFAEIAARTAKDEALLRAYKASGRGVAEFAEMYGLQPSDVEQALARAAR